jgi:hypothetical protein
MGSTNDDMLQKKGVDDGNVSSECEALTVKMGSDTWYR